MFTKKELDELCIYIKRLNSDEALNIDDIDQIKKALKKFNGEN